MVVSLALHADVHALLASAVGDRLLAPILHVVGPEYWSALIVHLFELLKLGGA